MLRAVEPRELDLAEGSALAAFLLLLLLGLVARAVQLIPDEKFSLVVEVILGAGVRPEVVRGYRFGHTIRQGRGFDVAIGAGSARSGQKFDHATRSRSNLLVRFFGFLQDLVERVHDALRDAELYVVWAVTGLWGGRRVDSGQGGQSAMLQH